ncbi:MAG: hypothetical protein II904_05630, partial [Oscillospiraceae bacterium]|nr:hypothetical protein [Oscillospiraceae bacterium]
MQQLQACHLPQRPGVHRADGPFRRLGGILRRKDGKSNPPAAKGAEAFYTTDNNTARVETLEEAIELDAKTLAAWAGHPHLRII